MYSNGYRCQMIGIPERGMVLDMKMNSKKDVIES